MIRKTVSTITDTELSALYDLLEIRYPVKSTASFVATFEVPLAQPKERHRTSSGRTYTPAKTAAAEQAIGFKFREAARGHRVDAAGRYRLWIAVRGANPLSDLDNHAKTVMDALNGICWKGDNQVDELLVTRLRGAQKQTTVVIYRIEEGS